MRSEARLAMALVAAAASIAAITYVRSAPASPSLDVASWPEPAEVDSLSRYLTPATAQRHYGSLDSATLAALSEEPDDYVPDAGAPEAPRSAAPAEPREWRVSAIVVGGDRRVAIINDSVVTQGDRLPGGARVQRIEPDHVVIVQPGGARHVLRF